MQDPQYLPTILGVIILGFVSLLLGIKALISMHQGILNSQGRPTELKKAVRNARHEIWQIILVFIVITAVTMYKGNIPLW